MHRYCFIFPIVLLFTILTDGSKAQAVDGGGGRPVTSPDTTAAGLDSLNKKIAELETEIRKLNAELEKQKILYETLRKQGEQRDIELNKTRQEILESKRQAVQYQARSDQNQSELEREKGRSRQELDMALKRAAEAEKSKKEADQKIAELQNQLDELKNNRQE